MLKIIAPQAVSTACPFSVFFYRSKQYISAQRLYNMRAHIRLFIILFSVLLTVYVHGQRLPFENFNVEKGLSQSQVTSITQDMRNYLWIGTIGGLNRFDGTRFKTFSRQDGISSGYIACLYTSQKGDIWIGTAKGISYYNGHRFTNLHMPGEYKSFGIAAITEDEKGFIYALGMRGGIFVREGDSAVQLAPPVKDKSATCLFKAPDGKVLVYIYQNGFYELKNKTWQKLFDIPNLEEHEFVRLLTSQNDIYYVVTSKRRILKMQAGKVIGAAQCPQYHYMSANISKDGDIWLGTSQGVLVVNNDDLSVKKNINAINGLSDNLIYTIYKDADHNLWLGSDGDGLFKYTGGAFTKYDKNTGLPGNVVMGFAPGKNGSLLAGIRESGLLSFDTAKKTFSRIDYSKYSRLGVNSLGSDRQGNVYIGTMDNHLLKINGKKVSEIRVEERFMPSVYTIKSYNDRVLLHTGQGGYWLDGDSVIKIKGISNLINSIMLANGDLAIGGEDGVSVLAPDGKISKGPDALTGINVSCFEQWRDYIVVASLDDGLFFWNRASNKVYACNSSNGLKDNNVFAVMKDKRGNLWVGTSSGIQQVRFDAAGRQFIIKQFGIADGYESSETNLNAIIENNDRIWIGTTRGLYIYNPGAEQQRAGGKPLVVIEKVEYSKAKDTSLQLSAWEHLPVHPKIEYAGNSISFNFRGIYLADPASLSYTHQLYGYDTGFSAPQKQIFLNYNNLPPGNYVFKVKAVTPDGVESEVCEYPFTIITPFYKTAWFALLIVLGLIGLGILIQTIFAREKRKRLRQMKQIKEKEQQKIREQTAEDFHDELGNKLTRIAVLADVLQNKTDPADAEKRNIIEQIRSNALGLYTGTKEIIWSLAKESDNLKDILVTIRQTGVELFSNTNVEFTFSGLENIDDNITISTGYNRHVIMIFKELLSNSMRHAHATQVMIDCKKEAEGTVVISFIDNGRGFDKNTSNGNGLNNIRRRAEKINGIFTIDSAQYLGTTCSLIFNISGTKKNNKKQNLL